jgi:hypothetical protein
MTSSDIKRRLANAILSGNLLEEAEKLVAELESLGASVDVVEPILRCLEANPEEDFGTPGPLVHYIERSFRHRYTGQLLQSLKRKPTTHTLWMLNRIFNGAKDEGERNSYMNAFREAHNHPKADQLAREDAAHFLQRAEQLNS